MHREIKFRGKRIDSMEWKYGDLLHIVGGCVIYHGSQKESELIEDRPNLAIELYMDEVSPVTPDTVGQFTGVKDKNGKEIYEGDIVKWDECVADYKFITHIMEVSYYKNSASFEPLSEYCYDSFEVIGNIHDNPELLKTE